MITEEQRQYIEEVLGVTYFSGLAGETAVAAPSAATSTTLEVLVLTPALDDEQRALLTKILGSVKIAGFTHIEMDQIQPGQFPEGVSATHVLTFTEGQPGRTAVNESVWWTLPALKDMIGANADVVTRKKEAWNWLQQFSKERSAQ